MHKNNFILAIKSNNNILREFGENVFLAFGSTYSIYLQNNESRKAVADIYIDGKIVMKGLIVNANSNVTLERFYEDNNESGHKFKFIEKTEKISSFRGDFPEDGIVKVKWKFEIESPVFAKPLHIYNPGVISSPSTYNSYVSPQEITGYTSSVSFDSKNELSLTKYRSGITGKGEYSQQKFTQTYAPLLEFKEYTMSISLNGKNQKNDYINKAVEVKTSLVCDLCNTKNKSSNKFCGECGNSLI